MAIMEPDRAKGLVSQAEKTRENLRKKEGAAKKPPAKAAAKIKK